MSVCVCACDGEGTKQSEVRYTRSGLLLLLLVSFNVPAKQHKLLCVVFCTTEIGPKRHNSLSLNCILYLKCSVRINYGTLISVRLC